MKYNLSVYGIFHPLWKFITTQILTFYGILGLIRELLPDKIQHYLLLKEIFSSVPWYLFVIIGLIVFIIIKFMVVPSYFEFINEINKKASELIKDHNSKTTDSETINGITKLVYLSWPPDSKDRDWTIERVISYPWHNFRQILETIHRKTEIYEFIKSKSDQYGINDSYLNKLRSYLPKPILNSVEETELKIIIKSLLNMAIDIKP